MVTAIGSAIEYIVNELPGYEPVALESTINVLNVPVSAGRLADETGPVTWLSATKSVKPGGREPVHCSAPLDVAPTALKKVPHTGAAAANVQPVGATTVIDVTAHGFVVGFVTETPKALGVPPMTTLGLPETVGGACVTAGPETAVGLLLTVLVAAPPLKARAGKNAKELKTSSTVTTRYSKSFSVKIFSHLIKFPRDKSLIFVFITF